MRFQKTKKIIVLLVITGVVFFCGKKKDPLLLLLAGASDQTKAVSGKGDIPLFTEGATNSSDSQNLQGTVIINDQVGQNHFDFNTEQTIGVNIYVGDPSGPVSGVNVNVTDPKNGNVIMLQAITDSNGNVSGNIVVPTATEQVDVNIQIGNHTAVQTVVLNQSDGMVTSIDREVIFNQEIENLITQIKDSDGDGIDDKWDSYPKDPTRATRIVIPASGISIVGFEDLYPRKGDADANDVVLQVSNEEDLNAQGQIVRIRGKYKLLARGAGYTHAVFLNLPSGGIYKGKVYDANDNLVVKISTRLNSFRKLPVFIKNQNYFQNKKIDNKNIYFTHELCQGMCNVYANQTISPAYSSVIEIIFDNPIERKQLPSAPYDLYIYVVNSHKEIHFPGFYQDSGGNDLYLDDDGFPWVFRIPMEWNWPLEKHKIFDAYPYFDDWYKSEGNQYKDWYQRFDDTSKKHQYQYFNVSPISAYFLQFGGTQQSLLWTFLAIFTSGILVFLFIKGRRRYEI